MSLHVGPVVVRVFPKEEKVEQEELVSHPVLRPNQMLIVCVPKNQVYTHIIQKMNTE
jgi:hypothetical protein